jgi:exodeoxyribonuclease VII small subunit
MTSYVAPRKKKPALKSVEEMSLESAIQELTELVGQLESGQQPLNDALEQFERGMLLLKECSRQLDAASGRIEVVRRMTDEGIETEPFDATATIDRNAADSFDDGAGSLF